MRNLTYYAAGLAVLGLIAGGAGCNSATDDPDTSENQISVAAVSPTTACVDVDGDGTTIYNVLQDFTLQSRTRGSNGGAVWNDAYINSVDITYTMDDGGSVPPPLSLGLSLTVKANSTGTTPVETVPVSYIPAYFPAAGRLGHITLKFKGRDAGGEVVSVRPVDVPLRSADVCGDATTN